MKHYIHRPSYSCKKKKVDKDESDDEEEKSGISVLKKLLDRKIDCIGNHIWFNNHITNDSASKLIRLIHERNTTFEQKQRTITFANLEPKPIYLHINSLGGDLQETFAIIDSIRNSKIPIYTVIDGCAASGATLISIVGKKRFMTENSTFLIHELRSGAWGKMSVLEDEHENNQFFMDKLTNLYLEYTKIKKRDLKKILKRDMWWDVNKCLQYGMIDEIYSVDNVNYT
jgi:ATP-dependent protease ClpP protease subunit